MKRRTSLLPSHRHGAAAGTEHFAAGGPSLEARTPGPGAQATLLGMRSVSGKKGEWQPLASESRVPALQRGLEIIRTYPNCHPSEASKVQRTQEWSQLDAPITVSMKNVK